MNKMGGACSTHDAEENANNILIDKLEEKRPYGNLPVDMRIILELI
jgi:hypothetical protein